ncbi:hypothetical protein BD560DRAFT_382582 [Blakeslea trispora]|nr:hypothetical protein BD560DRAFT_382582 [Blakeslea trispora]
MSDKENNKPLESIKKDSKPSELQHDKTLLNDTKSTELTEPTNLSKQDDLEVSVEKARRSAAPGLAETPWNLEDSVELARPSKTVLKEVPIQKSGYINIHHKQLQTTVLLEPANQVESLEAEISKVQRANTDKRKQLLALKDQIKHRRKELGEMESTASQVTTVQDNINQLDREIGEHKEMFTELSGMLKEVDETWSKYQQEIEKKEQLIEERLNQLSTVKYQILELEEQI